jgi:hypothetical protein
MRGSWAQLRDPRCRNSEEEIAEQLSGPWREDHRFSLRQGLRMYDAIQQRIADYDREILRKLTAMQPEEFREQPAPKVNNPQKARSIQTRGQGPMREALYRMSGVDLTAIDAVETIEVVRSEYGPDLSRFPTEKAFVSHVTLAPRRPMSGGKPVRKKKRTTASRRVAAALRMAALSLRHSATALGAHYRRIARRMGGNVAVFATVRKLAILIYRLLRWGSSTSMEVRRLSKSDTRRSGRLDQLLQVTHHGRISLTDPLASAPGRRTRPLRTGRRLFNSATPAESWDAIDP